jgi:hypothetical protein
MPVETEKYVEVVFEVISSACRTHGCNKRLVYGIKAQFIGETTEVIRIKDISTDKNDVLRLIALLNEYGVSRDHFSNVVEDFSLELYM